MQFCEHCGHQVTDGIFCPVCGSPLNHTYPANSAGQDAAPKYDDGYTQPYSTAPSANDYSRQTAYVPNQPLYPSYPPSQPPQPKKSRAGLIAAIVTVIVVLLAGAGVLVYFLVIAPNQQSSPVEWVSTYAGSTDVPAASEDAASQAAATEKPSQAPSEVPTQEATEAPAISETAAAVANATAFSSASADSTLGDQKDSSGTWHSYGAENVLKSDSSCWSTNGSGVGKSITLNLPEKQTVTGLYIINGYAGSEKQYRDNSKPVKVKLSFSDGPEETHVLTVYSTSDRNTKENVPLYVPHDTTYVRITIESIAEGDLYQDTCMTYIAPY